MGATVNSAVVVVVPVIISHGSRLNGPVPLWGWIVVGVIVATFFTAIGWALYDDWKWERRHRR